MAFYVYIVASRRNGTIYIGMTDDLAQRIWQHKTRAFAGFTARYGCDQLVWYEVTAARAPFCGSASLRNGGAVGN